MLGVRPRTEAHPEVLDRMVIAMLREDTRPDRAFGVPVAKEALVYLLRRDRGIACLKRDFPNLAEGVEKHGWKFEFDDAFLAELQLTIDKLFAK